jgi:hypothetical protein
MPAASAEKRACQRANKVLRANTTTEPAVLTALTPEIVSPPAQSTECTPVLQSSTSSSSTSINFETFVEFADLDNILRFCDAAASTQDGRNLKLLWDRAFEAGLSQGRSEEREFRDEMYLRGKAQGFKEAEEAASNAEIDFYRHGIEKGRTEEQSEWISAGHGPHCLTPLAILSDHAVQTDSEPSLRTSCDASTQSDDYVDGMHLTNVLKIGFEKGQVYGIIQEREQWESAGHSTCSVTTSSSTVTSDAGIQADLVVPMPQYVDTSTQSISVDIRTPTSRSDASTQSSLDFDPLNNAESVDILCAFSAVAPSSTPLGLIWQRAFEAGTQASQVDVTDDLAIPPTPQVDASIQTLEPPPLEIPPQITDPPCLDWSEDVGSLPIILPPQQPCQPRDLSALRSSSPSPFASLRRRSRCQGSQSYRQSYRRQCLSSLELPYPRPQYCRSTSHRTSYTPQKPKTKKSNFEPVTSHQASHLNWDSDPRLADLNRSLKALGWIRAH